MQIPNLIYSVQTLITAPEINIDLLWDLSIFFGVLALLYLVSVFLFRNSISSKSSLTKQRKTELSPIINEFLFYEDDGDKSEKSNYIRLKIEIREWLKDDFNRKVLVEILLDLRKDVSGDTQKGLFKLYEDLGLEKDAFKKLESRRWEVISKGIHELTQMQIEEAYGFIVRFINDRRGTIRQQAEIATITLKPEGINYFLDTTKYKISEWQQLKLLDVLRNKEDFEPPRFKVWLTSTNKHVVLFALRLIKYYNQNDANASLIELAKHKDQQIRQQAIGCIKEFYVIAALPIIKGIFWRCTADTKIAILGAIAELGEISDIEFLESVSQRERNFSVKSKAIGAINTITPESVMPTENIEFVKAYQTPEEGKATNGHIDKKAVPENTDELLNGNHDSVPMEDVENEEKNFTHEGETHPKQGPPKNNVPMTNPQKPKNTLRNIKVDVEEVHGEFSEEVSNTEVSHFDITEINFLPLVIDDETMAASEKSLIKYEDQISTVASMDMEVGDDEISPESTQEELQALTAEINELDFLPIVIDEEMSSTIKLSDERHREESGSLEDIEGYSLSDFEVVFEEKNDAAVAEEDENVQFDLEDAPLIEVDNPHLDDVMSWLMAENELRGIECKYETVPYSSDNEILIDLIPQPVYYDEHEAYMMGLLDDLQEMGDHREIPLLEELRAEEGKSSIKDRIGGLIDKFARERDTKTKTSSNTANEATNLPVFSVFADLFKSIDAECKLILLDEVIAVGDEKEIEFLDGLLEDSDQRIRSKAQTVLKSLIAKLVHENPSATYSQGVSAILAEQIKEDENLSQHIYDGLLSEMELEPTLPPEMFDIDFELCEVLDKKYDKKILDIPVIVTDVSSNENEGSFFNQLHKFSKLFF